VKAAIIAGTEFDADAIRLWLARSLRASPSPTGLIVTCSRPGKKTVGG